jgi:hypothetical protein
MDMLRVGIVAEGPTDMSVLEEIMKTIVLEIEFVRIQPAGTMSSQFGNGWLGVKKWCKRYGPELESYMIDTPSQKMDLLVIHADCSMADKEGAERPCPPASDTAEALKKAIEQSWLGRDPVPEFVVLATPAMSSDAWVAAAFEEPYPNLLSIECDKAVEDEFVKRKIFRRKTRFRMRNGHNIREVQVKKNTDVYDPMAVRCGQFIDSVCSLCPQAESFRSNFQAAVARTSPPSAP